jgi:hypothetical protein
VFLSRQLRWAERRFEHRSACPVPATPLEQ